MLPAHAATTHSTTHALGQLHVDWPLVWTVADTAAPAVCAGVLAIAILLLARALVRRNALPRTPLQQAEAGSLGEHLAALRAELARCGERIDALQSTVASSQATLRAANRGSRDFHGAERLAARGAEPREIASRTGLMRAEASVLVALQQARARRLASMG
jgi:hypothetical protein